MCDLYVGRQFEPYFSVGQTLPSINTLLPTVGSTSKGLQKLKLIPTRTVEKIKHVRRGRRTFDGLASNVLVWFDSA